jgi:DUF1365 family protein
LITLPRVLGYGFNLVSFWLCYNQLRAVLENTAPGCEN